MKLLRCPEVRRSGPRAGLPCNRKVRVGDTSCRLHIQARARRGISRKKKVPAPEVSVSTDPEV